MLSGVWYFKICLISVVFTPIRPPQLHLRPIVFEVPHPEGKPLFLGREWVFKEMEMVSKIVGIKRLIMHAHCSTSEHYCLWMNYDYMGSELWLYGGLSFWGYEWVMELFIVDVVLYDSNSYFLIELLTSGINKVLSYVYA